ncbi:MAG: type II secretion system F family protein, partial [Methanomassiliicoccales archaeon]
MKRSFWPLVVMLAVFLAAVCPLMLSDGASADDMGPTITVSGPGPDSTISNRTPEIAVEYSDPDGIDVSSVVFIVDGMDVTDWEEETSISTDGAIFITPSVLAMEDGQHNVTVEVADSLGNVAYLEWSFTIDPGAGDGGLLSGSLVAAVIKFVLIGIALAAGAGLAYVAYLKRFRRFTFRKYFIRNADRKKKILVVYVPLSCAVLAFLVSTYLMSIMKIEDAFADNYIFVVILVAALLPVAISSRMDLKRTNRYERAFAQFLFELADAIRGGVDPAKAVVELSITNRSILKENLRAASDGIRIGKPFDEVFDQMVQPMDSDLVKRYASLVGESSRMGGDISIVIHRAAQDMDELIKIEEERRRQLMMQATTIYIGFSVIMVIIYQLV